LVDTNRVVPREESGADAAMSAFEHPPARSDGSDRSVAFFSIVHVAIPFATFALVYAFRSEWSVTTRESLIGFVVTVIATAGAVLLYDGPSRRPARVAAVVMGVFFAASELAEVVGLGMGGACGGDGGAPNALPGSPAAAFCGHAPETRWEAGMLSVFAILIAGHRLSRRRALRWPLAVAFLVAGGLFVALASYAQGLSTSMS
jgi:hypothetical protein